MDEKLYDNWAEMILDGIYKIYHNIKLRLYGKKQMIIKYSLNANPIHKDATIFKISTLDNVGKNLIFLLKENGYTDLIYYEYPLYIPELEITIKGYTYQI